MTQQRIVAIGVVCLLLGALWWCAVRMYDFQRHYQQQQTMQIRLSGLQNNSELQHFSEKKEEPISDKIRMLVEQANGQVSSIEEKGNILQLEMTGTYLHFLDFLERMSIQEIPYQLQSCSISKSAAGVTILTRWTNALDH